MGVSIKGRAPKGRWKAQETNLQRNIGPVVVGQGHGRSLNVGETAALSEDETHREKDVEDFSRQPALQLSAIAAASSRYCCETTLPPKRHWRVSQAFKPTVAWPIDRKGGRKAKRT